MMFSTFTNAFNKFVGIIKKNGIAVSTYCALLIIMVYSVIINPINFEKILNQRLANDTEQHVVSVEKRLMADQLVPPILENIRLKFGLDRVCLLEMHNSTQNINHVSFLYMSLTYEQYDFTNDSIISVADSYQNQRTSEYYDIFETMEKQGYVYIEDLENYNGRLGMKLCKRMVANGAKSVFIVPLTKDGRIDAMLVLTSRTKSMDIKHIGANISTYVEKLRTLVF